MILPDHQPMRWFTPYTIFNSLGDGTWSIVVLDGAITPNPWEWVVTAQSSTNLTCYYPGMIDMGGLERQGKTLNPLGYSVARYTVPFHANDVANSGVTLTAIWVTSTKPIPPALISTTGGAGASWAYSLESAEDYAELVGYHAQAFSSDSSLSASALRPIDAQTMGALQATAVPTLHTQLMLDITWSDTTTDECQVFMPPAVVTIPQEIVKEDDLEYIYRLKRHADPNQVEN